MTAWTTRLGKLGKVAPFDYPYQVEGRRSPDRMPKLLAAHQAALESARKRHRGPVVLAGKSMGSRIGCHLSLEADVDGLVCFGYPLKGMGQNRKIRDEVLRQLKTPILFVQGTRDALCPLDLLASVRKKMRARSELFVVEAGDHSLRVTKTQLAKDGRTQDDVDDEILGVVRDFVGRL
jgi:predicted alpha/beta-hydrolase family hydrolase